MAKWSDIQSSIKKDAAGGIKVVTDVDSVKTSITNILRTRRGSRVMLPEFASTLSGLLFENITPDMVDRLGNEVKRVIETWDNRVSITSVAFNKDPDNSKVSTTIEFVIRGDKQVYEHTQEVI